jgi:hypothetical protein
MYSHIAFDIVGVTPKEAVATNRILLRKIL